MKPGIPRARVAECAHVPPSQHERVLDRVLCELRVPQDEPGGAVQPGERRRRQLREGLVISGHRPFDECSLHRRRRFGAGPLPALSYGTRQAGASGVPDDYTHARFTQEVV